jgi:hypothetical protein
MQDLQSLDRELQTVNALFKKSVMDNDPMVRVTHLYSRMKKVELRIRGRKSLLFRKDALN